MTLAYFYEITGAEELSAPQWCSESLWAHICRRSSSEDRRRSLAAWRLAAYALRQLGYSELLAPAFSPQGAPMLPDSPLHLCVAHSGRFAAASVSDAPVGIDVEQISARDLTGLAQKCLNASEQRRFAADPQRCFYRCWTAKEAYVKLTGEGLRGYPAAIELFEDDTVSSQRLPAQFTALRDAHGLEYCLCLVTAQPAPPQAVTENDLLAGGIL